MAYFWTIVVLVAALAVAWRFLGSYMAAVFDGRVHWLGFLERPLYRALGTGPDHEQTWKRYAGALLVFSAVSVFATYLVLRLQGSLPLNPQHLGAVSPALAWNTAVSFVTNTNWQNYGGETTLSYLSQMTLVVQQFVTPAVGIAVAIALVRGLSRRSSQTVGNFWVDVTRCMLYILLPIAFVAGIVLVGQGAVQTLAGPVTIHDPLNGVTQVIARGPIAFMEAIKQLGTNGGGFLNANAATTFENPTGFTNLLLIFLLLVIPFSLTYTLGAMVGSRRQGAAVLAVMAIIFGTWVGFTSFAEHQPNPAVAAAGLAHQPTGNMEGKEVRFGDTSSALFNVASTQTSTGSVNSSADSFTPMGGFGMLTGMMLGEVSPGGDGSGLYTILLFAVIAVFIGGLMIGRTPEYLGKKIQAREVKLAGLGVLVMPIAVLVLTGLAVSLHAGRAGPTNVGPHGFTEILYAITSQGNNNGSAFAGLNGNTAFYNVIGGIDMLIGRFAIIVPVLALAGALAAKAVVPESLGTFRTDKPMFVGLTIGAILIVGGLTFFPAVSLGPIVEQLSHGRFF
ncbi:MAG: potassium-transporting ATPase subunit KdpA [Actinomycetota bacterium]|nr:potassium-transporting ATPase subunit KdpA [Actinomycetota bacterium]